MSSLVDVETTYGVVEPDVTSVKRGNTFPALLDLLYLILGQQVTTRVAALHSEVGELVVHRLLFLVEQHQRHLDDFGFAVGIRREIAHLRARLALREVVFLVAGDTLHGKALHIVWCAVLTVAIDDIVSGAVVVLVENVYMNHLLSNEEFRLQLDHGIFAILMEDDDVVHIRAIAHIFVGLLVLLALQALTCTDEAFFPIDIQLFVVGSHGHGRDIVEVANLGLAFAPFTIFLLDVQEIVNGIVYNMVEVILGLFHLLFNVGQLFVGLLDVELGDLTDGFFAEFLHIFSRNLSFQQLAVLVETALDACELIVPSLIVLVFQLFIYAFLEENLLQRNPMPTVFQLLYKDT